jgi:hypothetical protein
VPRRGVQQAHEVPITGCRRRMFSDDCNRLHLRPTHGRRLPALLPRRAAGLPDVSARHSLAKQPATLIPGRVATQSGRPMSLRHRISSTGDGGKGFNPAGLCVSRHALFHFPSKHRRTEPLVRWHRLSSDGTGKLGPRLGTANAALVRSLVRRASSSATEARMCSVKRSPQPSLHRFFGGRGCCEP